MDEQSSRPPALAGLFPSGDAPPDGPGADAASSAARLVEPGGIRAPAPSPQGPGGTESTAKQAAARQPECPLTIGQVQRILEMRLGFTVSINTLRRWCRQGKISAVRLGPEYRIPRETVEEIIKTALNGDRF